MAPTFLAGVVIGVSTNKVQAFPDSALRNNWGGNRYDLVSLIGEGSSGEVWEAVHRRLGRTVAIKILRPVHLRRETAPRRFEAEARALTRIANRHVVAVLDLDETEAGIPFMVMERLYGCTLRELLTQEAKLPLARAVSLIGGAAEGVAAAHEAGLVHRDLKPENLFICRGDGGPEYCKVLDFGVARHTDANNFTREGALIGTVRYMAPEQAKGERSDRRTDVYALGLILYEAVVGKPWHPGEIDSAILFRIMNAQGPNLDDLPADLCPAFGRVLTRALSPSPQSRFQTAGDLVDALRALRSEQTPDQTVARLLPCRDATGGLGCHETVPDECATGSIELPRRLPSARITGAHSTNSHPTPFAKVIGATAAAVGVGLLLAAAWRWGTHATPEATQARHALIGLASEVHTPAASSDPAIHAEVVNETTVPAPSQHVSTVPTPGLRETKTQGKSKAGRPGSVGASPPRVSDPPPNIAPPPLKPQVSAEGTAAELPAPHFPYALDNPYLEASSPSPSAR